MTTNNNIVSMKTSQWQPVSETVMIVLFTCGSQSWNVQVDRLWPIVSHKFKELYTDTREVIIKHKVCPQVPFPFNAICIFHHRDVYFFLLSISWLTVPSEMTRWYMFNMTNYIYTHYIYHFKTMVKLLKNIKLCWEISYPCMIFLYPTSHHTLSIDKLFLTGHCK